MNGGYEIVYSRRRTLALQVARDGRVIVRAPYFTARESIERFVAGHETWICKALEKQARAPEMRDDPEELRRLYALARSTLPGLVERYARQMRLYPSKIGFGRAKTRFGSCSAKSTLNFSVYLMLYPPAAVEYVVVHELAHLKSMDHGRRFYALVASVLPDYRERIKLLKN